MSMHPFDQATQLQAQADGSLSGQTSPAYWNMVGPYGGITAAITLQAVMQHPDRLGEPIALTVNFAAGVAEGPFQLLAVPVRTNRSTQHWTVTLGQLDADGVLQVSTTATVITAKRRDTWSASDALMPAAPLPESIARAVRPGKRVAWLDRYDIRVISGGMPSRWDGQGEHSLSELWMRDDPPRPLDFPALAALADLFFPRIWLRRATLVPVGTVSMTVYFHADQAQLAASGSGYLLGQARGQGFRNGFFDHSGLLWNQQGLLLASTHQIVYYKA